MPAHVHITGAGHAKVDLVGAQGVPEIVFSVGIKQRTCESSWSRCDNIRQLCSWHGSAFMGGSMDKQIAAARRRGEERLDTDPRAIAARFEPDSGRISIELANGCSYAFPAECVQDLAGATPESLTQIEIDGLGYNLAWPALDVDLYVPALVAGVFGTRAWMSREFARDGGRTRSPAKSAAARVNGAKGGRPRKSANR